VSCCDPRGCDRFFGRSFAGRAANRYRRKGLDATGTRIVSFLRGLGLEGASVLEIGGGVGAIQMELLKAGAARATNLELSPAYEDDAAKLLGGSGLQERVERRIHDIAAEPGVVAHADFVVLNRVVCCYPDYERLLGAAAAHARRGLVFSYPPRNAASRLVVGAENLFFRLSREAFRTFAHPPRAMVDVLERGGLTRTYQHRAVVWQVAGFQRAAP
jgi:magnesium-protoporphyrin O-methyltransferase